MVRLGLVIAKVVKRPNWAIIIMYRPQDLLIKLL